MIWILSDIFPVSYTHLIGEYKERSVSMQIWVWSKNEYFYDLNDDLWVAVRDIFKEQNIKIPSQQIDVHIQQNDIKS